MSSQDLEIDDMLYTVPDLTASDPTMADLTVPNLTVAERFMLVATIGLGILATVLAASLIAPLL